MADVRGRGGSVAPEYEGRGQLILVTALSMAVLFVSLALILNTAIYTENLATRSSDIGGGTDAVRYHDAARDGIGGAIKYINHHNNTSFSTLDSNLTSNIDAFENRSARIFASGDRSVETNLDQTVDGTRIAQTETDRNFSDKESVDDWTLVEDVDHTRSFQINVTDNQSLDGPSGDPFEVVIENVSENEWRLNVTDESSTTIIGIDNGTQHFTCAADTQTPVIDLTAGTINGTPCEGLIFAEGLEPPYSITFNNGDNINGTYSLVVNNSSLAEPPLTHFYEDGDGQPFVSHAIYSANVTVVYETPRLFYKTTVRVAPGETDE